MRATPARSCGTRVVRRVSGTSSVASIVELRTTRPRRRLLKSPTMSSKRDARIAQNQAFLASLGLGAAQSPQKVSHKT